MLKTILVTLVILIAVVFIVNRFRGGCCCGTKGEGGDKNDKHKDCCS